MSDTGNQIIRGLTQLRDMAAEGAIPMSKDCPICGDCFGTGCPICDDGKPDQPMTTPTPDILLQIDAWVWEKGYYPGHRTGELLRACKAEIERLRTHLAILRAECRAWREFDQSAEESSFSAVWPSDKLFNAMSATDAAGALGDTISP